MQLTPTQARSLIKAINRRVRRHNYFAGGRTFGVDFATWSTVYPQTAHAYREAAKLLIGRDGRFMPPFN